MQMHHHVPPHMILFGVLALWIGAVLIAQWRRNCMTNVTVLKGRVKTPPLYTAKRFTAPTVFGQFEASGTLCGHVDFVGPFKGTYSLSPDEVQSLIVMLQQARGDVLDNSDPFHDPRIVERNRA